jgi:predicted permease
MLVLLAAVGLLLLAICANVSNMLIAQGIAQRRDIAVRLALGASRQEIAIQAAAYAVCIAVAGGGIGMALAATGVRIMRTMPSAGGIPFSEVHLDGVVFAFATAVVTMGMSMASALPLMSAWRTPPAGVLREARSGDNRRTRRVHMGLVVVQVATSVALLIGAALFGRSLAALLRVDSGVVGKDLYTARIDMAGPSFGTASQQMQFLSRLLERLSSVPGIASVALISSLPPDGSQMRTAVSPLVAGPESPDVQTEIVAASPLTFATLGISVLHGRGFSDADGPNAPRVIVLSESVAGRLFPDRDPIGQTLPLAASSGGTGTPTVIGVVREVHYTGLASPQTGAVYLPFTQRPFRSTYLTVRTRTSESEMAGTLGRVLYEIDSSVALGRLRSWDALLEDATAQPRLRLVVLGLLSTLTVIVAMIGLYGVMAYAVSLRRREFAVRAALGASRSRLVSMVVAQGFSITAVGTITGAAIAFATSRFLSSLLFGLAPTDPRSFVTAAASMIVVGLSASAIPAWQATRVSFAAVLKSE